VSEEGSPVPATEITLVGGHTFRVQGSADEIETRVVAAARGSIMELVWLRDADTDQPLAINPEHVVALRSGDDSRPTGRGGRHAG
jgi:uncharacterized protein YlzI (FlbEa/FlbD family)